MNIITVSFNNNNIIISVHIVTIFAVLLVLFLLALIKFKCFKKTKLQINGFSLGLKTGTISMNFNHKEQEIAYKLWVEMSTRKIALPFDENNDVIIEIYNSWYNFFETSRSLLKDLPPNLLDKNNNLVNLTVEFLNEGLRPHLTKWQARYRQWYTNQQNTDKSPQEIQRDFPQYNELISDLIKTNQRMIYYRDTLNKIAFD